VEKLRLLSRRANQKDLHPGSRGPRHANRGQIFICISARGQDQDVRIFFEEIFRPEWFHKVRSRDFDLTALDQHPGNRLSQPAIVRGHKDARLPFPQFGTGRSCCLRPVSGNNVALRGV